MAEHDLSREDGSRFNRKEKREISLPKDVEKVLAAIRRSLKQENLDTALRFALAATWYTSEYKPQIVEALGEKADLFTLLYSARMKTIGKKQFLLAKKIINSYSPEEITTVERLLGMYAKEGIRKELLLIAVAFLNALKTSEPVLN